MNLRTIVHAVSMVLSENRNRQRVVLSSFAENLKEDCICSEHISTREKSCIQEKKEKEKLFQEIVESPVVVFFLAYDFFEHATCFVVTTFHGFADDFPVKYQRIVFSFMVQLQEVISSFAHLRKRIRNKCDFTFQQIDSFAYLFQMIHLRHEYGFQQFANDFGFVVFADYFKRRILLSQSEQTGFFMLVRVLEYR